jgi:hypothetical protein
MIGMPVATPPFPHRAIQARPSSPGLSATRQPLPAELETIDDDLHCAYWEPESAVDTARAGLREGPNTVLVALGPRMLVSRRVDVQIGDVMEEVRSGDSIITAQSMRVIEVLWRRGHQDIGLELISGGPVQEGS